MKPFLILQGRPEDPAADEEYQAFLSRGDLRAADTVRVRLEQGGLPDDLSLDDFTAVLMGGGPACVSDDPATRSDAETRIVEGLDALLDEICERDLPFFGCCYGIGALADFLGARVDKSKYGEPVSITDCTVTPEGRADPVLAGVPDSFAALVGHKEAVQELPTGCVHLVASERCPFQMIRHGDNVYATQFHPEADSESFVLRTEVYAGRGYFKPGEAEALIERVRARPVAESHLVLRNFVRRYRGAQAGR